MADTARGIVVTTDNQAYFGVFPYPLHRSCERTLEGWIEAVHPKALDRPFVMLVNEEGLIRELPVNPVGSLLYKTQEHGWPICGNIILMKEGWRDGEPDIVGLDDEEVEHLLGQLVAMGVTPKEDAAHD